ncbi:MAG: hypothetical protein IIB78_01020 [Proteobacteria bacterium]|nr:hypothetical protein [Pseudomonadota bacterium]
MLKLKTHHTPRISNSLAVFAALMLLVSALVGLSGSGLTAKDSADQTAGIDTAPTQTFASETPGGNSPKKNKSFKVSLFLFRSN